MGEAVFLGNGTVGPDQGLKFKNVLIKLLVVCFGSSYTIRTELVENVVEINIQN